jgi:hypothetical protein
MDELKLEPDSQRDPSRIIRKPGTSDVFIEMAPGLAAIKEEPKEETYMEPDGIMDSEPDDEQDPMGLTIKSDDSVVDDEDLPCPLAFLAVEINAEDNTWDDVHTATEVEVDGETHGENYTVHLEKLNDAGTMAWNGNVELQRGPRRPRKHVNMTEEQLAKRREKNRLRKRRYRASMSQEAKARERERNRLFFRRKRDSRLNEEIKRQTETDMTHTKTSVVPELSEGNYTEKRHKRSRRHIRTPVKALTPQQLERRRERNRTFMRKFRASLSAEELEKRREKDRLRKKRAKEVMKRQKQDVTFHLKMFGHSA